MYFLPEFAEHPLVVSDYVHQDDLFLVELLQTSLELSFRTFVALVEVANFVLVVFNEVGILLGL